MSKKTVGIAFVLGFFLICSINAVNAISLGVSPATLNYEIAPDYALEKTILVSTSNNEPMKFSISAEGELKNWTTFEPSSGNIMLDSPLRVKIKIGIPKNAIERTYEDIFTASASPASESGEGTGSKIAAGVAIRATAIVSSDFQMGPDAEKLSNNSTLIIILAALVLIVLIAIFWIKRR